LLEDEVIPCGNERALRLHLSRATRWKSGSIRDSSCASTDRRSLGSRWSIRCCVARAETMKCSSKAGWDYPSHDHVEKSWSAGWEW